MTFDPLFSRQALGESFREKPRSFEVIERKVARPDDDPEPAFELEKNIDNARRVEKLVFEEWRVRHDRNSGGRERLDDIENDCQNAGILHPLDLPFLSVCQDRVTRWPALVE